jgi:hypothetical protein
MPITIDGTTGISGNDGSAGTPALRGDDANTGMFFPAADTIAFSEGGTEVMRITPDARVGIGTTTPSTTLQVNGTVTATTFAGALTAGYTSSGFTLTRNYRGTFAHGFGATPSLIVMRLRCVTAQFNFSVNDVVYFYSGAYDNGTGQSLQFAADSTNIYLGTYLTYVRNKTTGVDDPAWVEITYANWQATLVAWK